jgi:hypothetical protein
MAWRALQSKHWMGADYNAEMQTLTMSAINGAVYLVRGVPQTVADTLFQSSSPGSYYHDKIKGTYTVTRIADGTTKSGRASKKNFG